MSKQTDAPMTNRKTLMARARLTPKELEDYNLPTPTGFDGIDGDALSEEAVPAQLDKADSVYGPIIVAGDTMIKYARHSPNCEVFNSWGAMVPCTCGFDEVQQAYRKARGG